MDFWNELIQLMKMNREYLEKQGTHPLHGTNYRDPETAARALRAAGAKKVRSQFSMGSRAGFRQEGGRQAWSPGSSGAGRETWKHPKLGTFRTHTNLTHGGTRVTHFPT